MTETIEAVSLGNHVTDAAVLPEGTVVGNQPVPCSTNDAYEKGTDQFYCGSWRADRATAFESSRACGHPPRRFNNSGWYVWHLPDTGTGALNSADLQPGFFGHPRGMPQTWFYVTERTAPDRIATIEWLNGAPRRDGRTGAFAAVPLTGPEHEVAKLRCQLEYLESQPVVVDQAVVQAAVETAVAAEQERHRVEMAALSERAAEWANGHDMCQAYDEFMSDPAQAKLGLVSRPRAYRVMFEVTGRVNTYITISGDEQDAEREAREAFSLGTDREYSVGDYSLYVTGIECEEVEQN